MKISLCLTALTLALSANLHCQPSRADDLPLEPNGEVQIPMNRPSLTPVADELVPQTNVDTTQSTQSTQTTQTTSDMPPEPEIIVRDGPLNKERSDLLRSIYKAKECGIGIVSYMKAFEYIEDMAAKSQPDDAIQKRIDSLQSGLDEQLKRSEQMKKEAAANATPAGPGSSHKLAPGNLLADPQAIPSSFTTMGGGAGGQSGELLDMIVKDKLGGKLPSQMTRQELQKKMKEVPELEDYLKKFIK